MVLLVFLSIVWAGVGVYWLKTRVPTPSMAMGGYSRRLPSLAQAVSSRPALVLPLGRRSSAPSHPGHSLTSPAKLAEPGSRATPRVSTEQARLRRRNVLFGLFGFAALTLLGAFAVGGSSMILLQLFADALLLGFILTLVQYQREIELDRNQHRQVLAQPRQTLAATGTDGR